eukprot:scaffold1052_cov339-Pavlova_lutheri.AAC.30
MEHSTSTNFNSSFRQDVFERLQKSGHAWAPTIELFAGQCTPCWQRCKHGGPPATCNAHEACCFKALRCKQ